MSRQDVVHVETLARVEGEGGVEVRMADGRVTGVQVRIAEPPRFFEAFLRGRAATEAPDLTARVCGICPVAYQFSACAAVENACGVLVTDEIGRLRRLLYCGEWISSHALHVYLLHAPDFLGCEGVTDLAAAHPDVVRRGLALKQAGNRLMEVIGGRSIHPVNVRVGGFYRFPARGELTGLRPLLDQALEDAVATVGLVSGFAFPDVEQPHEYLALRADDGYPLETGSPVSSGGAAFAVEDYLSHVVEEQVAWSHALHARLAGPDRPRRPDKSGGDHRFVVGPLARYALNSDRLTGAAERAARQAGLGPVCRNPFRSIVVRAVEIVYAVEEALRIIDNWTGAGPSFVDVPLSPGVGHGATEAPRGVLYHRYVVDDEGLIRGATIVPPTAQNLASMEADVRAVAERDLELPADELTRHVELAVRNYDPCISCATHLVRLVVE